MAHAFLNPHYSIRDNPHLSRHPSHLREWYERIIGSHSSSGLARHGEHGIHAVRQAGESIVTGAVLGAVHAHNDLELTVKKPDAAGKGGVKIPIDAAVGVLGMVASVALANHQDGLGTDARNIGSTALGIFSFRKTMDLIAEKKAQKGQATAGTVGTPTVAKAAAGTAGVAAGGTTVSGEPGSMNDPILRSALKAGLR